MDETFSHSCKLLNYMAQPVFGVRDGKVVYRNRAAAEKLIQIGDDASAFACQDAALYDGSTPAHMNIRIGTETHGAAVEDLDGVRYYIVEPSKRELLHSDTLFTVSQSLRGPLTSLFTTSTSLFPMLEELENASVQKQLASLNRGFYQLLHLACNLSELHNAMQDEVPLHRERTELCSFFHDIFERAKPLCDTKTITLDCVIPQQTFFGWIDRQRIERAVLNLISNALKFTPAGGKITMRLENAGTNAIFRLTDSGEGFPPDVLASAFSRFDRELMLGDPRCGVGIGLPLVQKIAQLHGGSVIIQSKPGEGSSVSMSFSLKTPTAEQLVESPIAAIDYTGGYRHELAELADVLPADVYDSMNIN